jgi:hypothetical protein
MRVGRGRGSGPLAAVAKSPAPLTAVARPTQTPAPAGSEGAPQQDRQHDQRDGHVRGDPPQPRRLAHRPPPATPVTRVTHAACPVRCRRRLRPDRPLEGRSSGWLSRLDSGVSCRARAKPLSEAGSPQSRPKRRVLTACRTRHRAGSSRSRRPWPGLALVAVAAGGNAGRARSDEQQAVRHIGTVPYGPKSLYKRVDR